MPVYLVINAKGVVENAVKWDGEAPFDPGEGYELEQVSGEPGCPWIGWSRNKKGDLVPPPPPVVVRCAVYRKDTGVVVAIKEIPEGEPVALSEPSSFEYAIVVCGDDVEPGWTYADGEFKA